MRWVRSLLGAAPRRESDPAASASTERAPSATTTPAPTGGTLVVSNCQAYMLHAMMQLLAPREVFSYVTFWDLQRTCPGDEDKARFLSGFDLVFFQTGTDSFPVPAGVSARVVSFPPVHFFGFHPDLVYASVGGQSLLGPLRDYHSSIVVWSYVHGLPVGRVVSLFRRAVYERLGFLGAFDESVQYYLGYMAEAGMDMRAELSAWLRRGAFMHTPNHPKSYVLQDTARQLLGRACPRLTDDVMAREVSELVPDLLANGPVFPVYPEVGLHVGVRGDYLFKPEGALRPLSLQEFVEASYAAYGAFAPDRIRCERLNDERYAGLSELS